MSPELEKLLSPTKLNGLELRNRVLKAATFEGMTENGGPGDRLIKFHRDMAEGGVALTTLAYCAVEPDGKVKDNMMHMPSALHAPLRKAATKAATKAAE